MSVSVGAPETRAQVDAGVAVAYGSPVTLIASPRWTMPDASITSVSGMCRVIRSFTGTWPVEMYSSARLLCSGAEPSAPWMCSWR